MNNKKLIFIPFLILGYFFIHFITDLYYFLDPIHTSLQIAKYSFTVGCVIAAGFIFFKNKERFTAAFSALLFFFLFYGSLTDTFSSGATIGIEKIIYYLCICLAIILISIRLNRNIIKKLLQFWVLYCSVLIVYDVLTFVFLNKPEKKYLAHSRELKNFNPPDKPSLYFLLFDMYPSDTVYKKYLDFDNGQLNSFLKANEFYVTGNAQSEYEQTYLSLASTLNLQHLAYFKDSNIKAYKKPLIALKNIEQSLLPRSFVNAGYTFNNYSVFNILGSASPLQFNLDYHLENTLTASTFFNRLYNNFEPDFFLANRNIDLDFFKNAWSTNIKKDLEVLNTGFNHLTENDTITTKPSFNYFHFMMPHPPLLYDSMGRENSVKDMYTYNGYEKTILNFTGYTKFANQEIRKMVNTIFEKAGKNVIIIIQGDHGYRSFSDSFPDEVRYGILNAVYLPNKNYRNFNDTMTPVYTFKHILQNQFGLNFNEQ